MKYGKVSNDEFWKFIERHGRYGSCHGWELAGQEKQRCLKCSWIIEKYINRGTNEYVLVCSSCKHLLGEIEAESEKEEREKLTFAEEDLKRKEKDAKRRRKDRKDRQRKIDKAKKDEEGNKLRKEWDRKREEERKKIKKLKAEEEEAEKRFKEAIRRAEEARRSEEKQKKVKIQRRKKAAEELLDTSKVRLLVGRCGDLPIRPRQSFLVKSDSEWAEVGDFFHIGTEKYVITKVETRSVKELSKEYESFGLGSREAFYREIRKKGVQFHGGDRVIDSELEKAFTSYHFSNQKLSDLVRERFGVEVSGGPRRFNRVGWYYLCLQESRCPNCREKLESFRCPYKQKKDSLYWGLLCLKCNKLFERKELNKEDKKVLNPSPVGDQELPKKIKTICPNLFHLTHVGNLASILKHGLLSKNDVPDGYENLAYASAQACRRGRSVNVGTFVEGRTEERALHDMVPFFFTHDTPMAYTQHLQGLYCLIVVGIEVVFEPGVRFSFSGKNLASGEESPETFSSLDLLEDKVDWATVKKGWSYFKRLRRKHRNVSHKVAAEFLLNSPVSHSLFKEIWVKSEKHKECVEDQIGSLAQKVPVLVVSENFFDEE